MYDTQQALIEHLAPIKTLYGVRTIEAYAGQLADAAKDMTRKTLPAVFVLISSCDDVVTGRFSDVRIIVVTDSKAYDKTEHKNRNLALIQEIFDWIAENDLYELNGYNYSILNEFDSKPRRAEVLGVTGSFTVGQIIIEVHKN